MALAKVQYLALSLKIIMATHKTHENREGVKQFVAVKIQYIDYGHPRIKPYSEAVFILGTA